MHPVISKAASLVSDIVPAASLTRTKASVVGCAGIVQEYVPLFGALAAIVEKGPELPATEYSSFTFVIEVLAVQVIG